MGQLGQHIGLISQTLEAISQYQGQSSRSNLIQQESNLRELLQDLQNCRENTPNKDINGYINKAKTQLEKSIEEFRKVLNYEADDDVMIAGIIQEITQCIEKDQGIDLEEFSKNCINISEKFPCISDSLQNLVQTIARTQGSPSAFHTDLSQILNEAPISECFPTDRDENYKQQLEHDFMKFKMSFVRLYDQEKENYTSKYAGQIEQLENVVKSLKREICDITTERQQVFSEIPVTEIGNILSVHQQKYNDLAARSCNMVKSLEQRLKSVVDARRLLQEDNQALNLRNSMLQKQLEQERSQQENIYKVLIKDHSQLLDFTQTCLERIVQGQGIGEGVRQDIQSLLHKLRAYRLDTPEKRSLDGKERCGRMTATEELDRYLADS